MVRLEGMVGLGKQEEEPEGEIIVGPSGETLEPPDSGNTPFFLLELNDLYNHTLLLMCEFSPFFKELIHLIKTFAH